MIADKKRILKQFQWFQVQTKVRQLVGEILQSFQKKLNNQSSAISRLNETSSCQKQKLQQITLMINNDQNIFQNGIFTNIKNKFDNQSIHIKQLQNKIKSLQTFINEKSQILDKRLEQSTQTLRNMNIFKDDIKKQIKNQSQIIISSQNNIFNSFYLINKQMGQFKIVLNGLEQNLNINNYKINGISSQFQQINLNIDRKLQHYHQILKQTTELSKLTHHSLTDLQTDFKRLDKFQSINKKQQKNIQQCLSKMDELQYKIQVLQPLISFTQINQYAHKILPQKYHKNISIYYYNKYNELIEEVINNDYQSTRMKQSVKNNIENIKQCHKKAIKAIFKIKKDMLMERGIDINLCSHQKKEEYLRSIKLQENLQIIDQGLEAIKKKAVPEEQQINKVREHFVSSVDDLKERIFIQIKDSKKYIQSIEELLSRNINNIQNKVNTIQVNLQKDKMESQLHVRHVQGQLIEINKRLAVQKQNNKNNKLSIGKMQNILTILNEIQKQDEKDRLTISMFGVKQTHKDEIKTANDKLRNKAVIDIDRGCLSCSGNPNYYNQFFKLACLNYNSSPIRYNNQLYQRIQILQLLEDQLKSNIGQYNLKQGQQIRSRELQSSSRYQKHKDGSNEMMIINASSQQTNKQQQTTIRNIASSQEISRHDLSQEVRIISASQLSPDILNRTKNRFYSRKIQNNLRDSLSKRQLTNRKSKEKNSYMMHVSQFFRELKKHNEQIIKLE